MGDRLELSLVQVGAHSGHLHQGMVEAGLAPTGLSVMWLSQVRAQNLGFWGLDRERGQLPMEPLGLCRKRACGGL